MPHMINIIMMSQYACTTCALFSNLCFFQPPDDPIASFILKPAADIHAVCGVPHSRVQQGIHSCSQEMHAHALQLDELNVLE